MWNETFLAGRLVSDPKVIDAEEKAYLKVGVLLRSGISGTPTTEVYDVVAAGECWETCKLIGENRNVVVTGHSRFFRHELPSGELRHGFRTHARGIMWVGDTPGAGTGIFRMSVCGRVLRDPRLYEDWQKNPRTTMSVSMGYDSSIQVTTRGDWTSIKAGTLIATAGHVRRWEEKKEDATRYVWSLAVSYIKRLDDPGV